MSSLTKLYADEVERRMTELSTMDIKSDEYVESVDVVNSLMDRYVKMQDQENEYIKNCNDEEKVSNEKFVNILKIGTSVGIAVLYAGLQIWAVKDNQVYETVDHGMHTNEAGRSGLRNLMNLFGKVKM